MMVSSANDPRKAGSIWVLDLAEDVPVVKPLVEAVFQRAGQESGGQDQPLVATKRALLGHGNLRKAGGSVGPACRAGLRSALVTVPFRKVGGGGASTGTRPPRGNSAETVF